MNHEPDTHFIDTAVVHGSLCRLPRMAKCKCSHIARQWTKVAMILMLFCSIEPQSALSQQLSTNKDKFLGAGTSSPPWRNFYQYWNQVTPGNDGKWGSVSPFRGQYNWTNLDAIYSYAMNLGLLYKHHNLVWGNQQPSWVANLYPDTAAQRAAVEDWIRQVGQHYPKMDFVDVVNEPLHAPPPYATALGGNGATGWDWVIKAFQWARQYCAPGVKLILNDYSILGSSPATDNYLTIINLLKDRQLIDGIGIQGHYFEFRSHIGATGGVYINSPATIQSNLNRLTATGIPIYITEFDIDEPVDSNQISQYKTYFTVLWTNPGVKGITFWGYIQNDVWSSYPNTYLLYSDGHERPVMQWLRTYVSTPIPPTLVSPTAVTTPRNPFLVWRSSDLATSYHVQVSDNRTFAGFAVDTTIADTVLRLKPLAPNAAYYWRVSAVNAVGASDYSSMAGFTTADFVSAVESPTTQPIQFALSQNYPNPFNPSTNFEFRIANFGFVSLKVLDVLGREVATLVNDSRQPGTYIVHWDASRFPSGVYFYRMQARLSPSDVGGQAGTFVETKKMILAK